MGYRYALLTACMGAVLLASPSTAASAQCRLCTTPTSELDGDSSDVPLRLEVEALLDFDRLVLLGAGEGAATMLPNGHRSASGNIATVSPRAMVGSVIIQGEPGRLLQIDLPRRIDLYSVTGSHIAITDVESDLPSVPKLDSAGRLTFRFGGRLEVRGDADGDYRGDVPITVDYL